MPAMKWIFVMPEKKETAFGVIASTHAVTKISGRCSALRTITVWATSSWALSSRPIPSFIRFSLWTLWLRLAFYTNLDQILHFKPNQSFAVIAVVIWREKTFDGFVCVSTGNIDSEPESGFHLATQFLDGLIILNRGRDLIPVSAVMLLESELAINQPTRAVLYDEGAPIGRWRARKKHALNNVIIKDH